MELSNCQWITMDALKIFIDRLKAEGLESKQIAERIHHLTPIEEGDILFMLSKDEDINLCKRLAIYTWLLTDEQRKTIEEIMK